MYEVTVKVLSPLHVGGGDGQLTALDFFQDERNVFLIDPRTWAQALAAEGAVDLFVSHAQGEQPSLDQFLEQIERLKPRLADFLRKEGMLRAIPKGEERLWVTGNLHVFAIDPVSRGAYLPASSLKGALRAALLFHLTGEQGELGRIKARVLGQKQREPGKGLDNLLRAVLPRERNRQGPQTDWLRGFRLTDAYPAVGNCTEVREVRVASLNQNGGYHYGARGARLFVEVVRPGVKFRGRLVLAGEIWELLKRHAGACPSLDLEEWPVRAAEKCRLLLQSDTDFFRKAGLNRVAEELERMFKEGANLRLGWGSGLLGASAAALHFSRQERQKLRGLYFPRRQHPEFPQSRKVVLEGGSPVTTLGWVKVTVKMREGELSWTS